MVPCEGVWVAGAWFWGTWWCVPFFFVYGVLYGSSTDSRWHECGHGTAFKTRWMNDVIYGIASFMILREPTVWRWSHARHHTDTIIVGRDPEIGVPRPPKLWEIGLAFIGHLPEYRGGASIGDRIGEAPALRDARPHVCEGCFVHPH